MSEHVYFVAITFKMTEQVEQWICFNFRVKLEHSSAETIRRWCNKWSANKSVAQMLQRRSRICWQWSTFWKACNTQNPWECWTCTDCSQQRSATDSVRTRSWSGDSKHYCVWGFDSVSWHEMCQAKFIPLLLLPERKEHCAAVGRTVWGPKVPALRGLRRHCPMYNASCILYLLQ